ncbi:hypothetical protein ScPMuIL_000781 [Solemya velum]
MGISPSVILWILISHSYQIICSTGSFEDTKKDPVSLRSSVPEYLYHEIVIPEIYINKKKQDSTLHQPGQHSEDVTLKFQAFNKSFVIDLQRNRKLFSASYIEKRLHHTGTSVIQPPKAEEKHCYYHGNVRGSQRSSAALSTCSGVTGLIVQEWHGYYIEPAHDISAQHHRIYREDDRVPLTVKCGADHSYSHPSNSNATEEILHTKNVLKRMKRSIRGPYDSNANSRYVEMYFVFDQSSFMNYGRDTKRIVDRSHNIANIVSKLYEPLNIFVALVGVETWESGDKIQVAHLANNTLDNFLHYRKQRINPYHPNDNSQLITGKSFQDGVVGKAIKGAICTHQYSGGVNSDIQNSVVHIATTVAHELGHNFGMEHDNYSMCRCPDSKCIMSPTSGGYSHPSQWSSCSRMALDEAYELGMDYCLKNKPLKIFEGPVCGNGFLESGEECDCGLPEDCNTKCCNATTCKLTPKSTCATGSCCDLTKCQPKSAAVLCRPAFGECDLPEFCWGDTEFCPPDVHKQYGVPCKEGQSYCYDGTCKTHTDQCKLLWGSTGRVSDPVCFRHLNINGSRVGNCGYNWALNTFHPCNRDDTLCGLLHCVHLNEKLMFWKESLALDTPAIFLTLGSSRHVCRSATLDVGLDMPDPGMVPDGAKCGDRKICLDHKCTSLSQLAIKPCLFDCDNGVCNSNGNCHCDQGYAPPYCNKPGNGGSLDSGPVRLLEDNSLLVGMLIFFLVVLPTCGILAFLGYYHRRRLYKWWTSGASGLKYRVPSRPKKPPRSASNCSDGGTQNKRAIVRTTTTTGTTLEISTPILTGSTNRESKIHIQENPLVLTPPIVRKPSSLKKTGSVQSASVSTPPLSSFRKPNLAPTPELPLKKPKQIEFELPEEESTKKPLGSPKLAVPDHSDQVKKRESFKETISKPILISTTDRRSKAFVKDPVVNDDTELGPLGDVPPVPPHSVGVLRSKSDCARRPPPPRPTSFPPRPNITTDASKKSDVISTSLRMPERPPPPPVRPNQLPKPSIAKPTAVVKQPAVPTVEKNPPTTKPVISRPVFDKNKMHDSNKLEVASIRSTDSHLSARSTDSKQSSSTSDSDPMSLADLISKISSPTSFLTESSESSLSGKNEKQNCNNPPSSLINPPAPPVAEKNLKGTSVPKQPNKNVNKSNEMAKADSSLETKNKNDARVSPTDKKNNKGNIKSGLSVEKPPILPQKKNMTDNELVTSNKSDPSVSGVDLSKSGNKSSELNKRPVKLPLSKQTTNPGLLKPSVPPSQTATKKGTSAIASSDKSEATNPKTMKTRPSLGKPSDVTGPAGKPKPGGAVTQQKTTVPRPSKPPIEQRGQKVTTQSFNKPKPLSDTQTRTQSLKSPTRSEAAPVPKTRIKTGSNVKESESKSTTDSDKPSGSELTRSNSGVKALLAKFDSPQGSPQLGVARSDSRKEDKPSVGPKPNKKEVRSVNV